MILPITVMFLLVMQASLKPQDSSNPLVEYNQLYQDITSDEYDSAVITTVKLKDDGKSHIITLIVNRLLDESRRNVVDYAYNLVRNGDISIVSDHFPIQFRWMFTGKEITFINRRDTMALKLEWHPDRDGDRGAFGDKDEWEGKRMAWKLIPYRYDGSKVCFEILNVHFNQYLKLEVHTDDAGERRGFGDNEHNGRRHRWYFHPVLVDSEMLFYIFNVEYNQTLKLGRYVDWAGDRRLWSHNWNPIGSPEHLAWYIRLHSDFEKI